MQNAAASSPKKSEKPKNSRRDWKSRSRRFGNREQKELDALPERIEELDERRHEITAKLADPQTYKSEPSFAETAKSQFSKIDSEIETIYKRWEELEALKESLGSS